MFEWYGKLFSSRICKKPFSFNNKNVVTGRFKMAFDRSYTREKSYSLSVALGLFGKARRSDWNKDTHVFYRGQDIFIKFGNTGMVKEFIARRADIDAHDWVEYKTELCSTCITIKRLSEDKVPSMRTGKLLMSKSAEIMIDHLKEFHPCTCKK